MLELWRVGDLAIASPFLRAASDRFEVTLLAQSTALALRSRLFPEVSVVPFTAPWTVFRGKYHFWEWSWSELHRIVRDLRVRRFSVAVTSRWDPREHFLMRLLGVPKRVSFPKWGSQWYLTKSVKRLSPLAHRYDDWWVLARELGVELPARGCLPRPPERKRRTVSVHSGAALPVRVWPLDRLGAIVRRLRSAGFEVQVLCDPPQVDWWRQHGEPDVVAPSSLEELLVRLNESSWFIGNDSGAGHLAAACGVPTFTFFGPQLPEWFAPLHPAAEWVDGKPCKYKQCFDYCRFDVPHCLWDISESEAWDRIAAMARKLFHEPGPGPLGREAGDDGLRQNELRDD